MNQGEGWIKDKNESRRRMDQRGEGEHGAEEDIILTRSIKRHKCTRNLAIRSQWYNVEIFDLFIWVGCHPTAAAAVQVRVKMNISHLFFIAPRDEPNDRQILQAVTKN
jgi:hypothetical protein